MVRLFRKVARPWAIVFVLLTFANTLLPTISYALTSGPTAPEATSFEPVDTTDMVNLVTGDLTYNIPLLEVPGPAGSYPLSLSYHAGIMPGEEASWVGLGWTLNPGAITRSVNGYPDDFQNSEVSDRIYWEGGVTETYSVGVSVGVKGLGSVSAGLQISNDTYRGVGVGGYVGIGVGFSEKSPFGAHATIGISPYGGAYASAGLSVGSGSKKGESSAVSLGASVGVSTNFESVGAYAGGGISVKAGKANKNGDRRSFSLLGASISTGGGAPSLTVGGGSVGVHNSKEGTISTSVTGGSFDIPILPALSLSFGYQRVRYWMDETEDVKVNGVLQNPTPQSESFTAASFNNYAFDSYTLPESSTTEDPNKSLGPSFFNHDNYSVSAQGISGSFRPYVLKDLIFRQNRIIKKDNKEEIIQYHYSAGEYRTGKKEFRFINDFSNRYQAQSDTWANSPNPLVAFYGSAQNGDSFSSGVQGNKLIGSKNIEWYTNAQIINNQASNLINCSATGFNRNDMNVGQQIGAFKITNESGVTYHFSLPAYAYDEYQYSENIKRPDGKTFNEFKNPQPYAYTWFLTAITGPDYVDRGTTGKIDEEDWGYWVEFNYGKWTSNFAWRNPEEGFNQDLDNNFQNYSSGKKEIYYLDAIVTKSHTALFIKENRLDAKSSALALDLQKKSDLGFLPSNYFSTNTVPKGIYKYTTTYSHITYPIKQLKLREILLIENKILKESIFAPSGSYINQIKFDNRIGSPPDFSISYDKREKKTEEFCKEVFVETGGSSEEGYWTKECGYSKTHYDRTLKGNLSANLKNNILDETDPHITSGLLTASSIRKIDFTHSYSLVPQTSNSFDHPNLYSTNPPSTASSYPLQGKLTLDKITFKGKGGADLIPPLAFEYELENPLTGNGYFSFSTSAGLTLNQANAGLSIGDIIKFNNSYAVVIGISGSIHSLRNIGKNAFTSSGYASWQTTKNPPFNKDFYDEWGLYKPDVDLSKPNKVLRATSVLSSKSADVWCLRKVRTNLGSDIRFNYEADSYKKSVFQSAKGLLVRGMTNLSCENPTPDGNPRDPFDDFVTTPTSQGPPSLIKCRYRINLETEGNSLNALFQIGQTVYCILPYSYSYYDQWGSHTQNIYVSSLQVQAISGNSMDVDLWVHSNSYVSGGTVMYNYNKDYSLPGGGYRVKSIEVTDALQSTSNITAYDYNVRGVSSGFTSYEPDVFDHVSLIKLSDPLEKVARNAIQSYSNLKYARELPAPGVMYETVTVREFVKRDGVETTQGNYSEYQFLGLSAKMIGELQTSSSGPGGNYLRSYQSIRKKEIVLNDLTSHVGKLKSITLYDNQGKPISKTIHNYLFEETLANNSLQDIGAVSADYLTKLSKFNNQGLIDEVTWDARFVKQTNNNFDLFGVISKRRTFPTVAVGETNINYKTGITTITSTEAFDFYSGQVVKSKSTDGYGNTFLTEISPAYRVTSYSQMGPAALGGKNMLTQQAASSTFKINPADGTNLGLVSATAQTWSDQTPVMGAGGNNSSGTQPGIWRMKSSFSFTGNNYAPLALNGDGLQAVAGFQPFNNWITDEEQNGWQKNSEITLYDVYSHALEAKDVNQNYAATVMSQDQTRVVGTAANAQYNQIGYSGAEEQPKIGSFASQYELGNNVYLATSNGASWVQEKAHTGVTSLRAAPGQQAFLFSTGNSQCNTYRASVWSSQPDGKIKYHVDGGVAQTPVVKNAGRAGDWYLLEADVSGVSGYDNVRIWCEGGSASQTYFDDFRVHPVDAAITSYVYNNWGELTHILDNNNLYTKYEYDEMGRLKSTYREKFNLPNETVGSVKLSEIEYNYGLMNATPFKVTITTEVATNTSGVPQMGGSGVISPSVQVLQGGDAVISASNVCDNLATRYYVDGKLVLNSYGSMVTLYDGAKAYVYGGVCKLTGVLGEHTVKADFEGPGPAPSILHQADCEIEDGCFTGLYLLSTWDSKCGVFVREQQPRYKFELPADVLSTLDDCTNPVDCSQKIKR